MYKLVTGNRNYSSWSLRAWLFLTESRIPFEEIRIPMFTEKWQAEVAKYSPAGRVPVLIDGDIAVWDTMAIIEHLREKHPNSVDWPVEPAARAHARSISAEMHSGFLGVRGELPLNIRARNPRALHDLSADCRNQIARIDSIWRDCREEYGSEGPWLFGSFSIADVFYAPVALRFVSYDIPVSGEAGEFVSAVEALESVRTWIAAANAEEESLQFIDDLVPATSAPLTLG